MGVWVNGDPLRPVNCNGTLDGEVLMVAGCFFKLGVVSQKPIPSGKVRAKAPENGWLEY